MTSMWIPVRALASRSVSIFTSGSWDAQQGIKCLQGLVFPCTVAIVVVQEEEKKGEDVAVVVEGESEEALDVSLLDLQVSLALSLSLCLSVSVSLSVSISVSVCLSVCLSLSVIV